MGKPTRLCPTPTSEMSRRGSAWRDEHPTETVFLAQVDLRGADLSRCSPVDVDMSGANLLRADLFDAILVQSNFSGADRTHRPF